MSYDVLIKMLVFDVEKRILSWRQEKVVAGIAIKYAFELTDSKFSDFIFVARNISCFNV